MVGLGGGENKELDRTDGATHAAEQKKSGRAAPNTRCSTSLYDGDRRADTLAACSVETWPGWAILGDMGARTCKFMEKRPPIVLVAND